MLKPLNLLVLSLLVSSCGQSEPIVTHNYHEIKVHLINWNDIFVQCEDYYLVYFYSERCGHCKEIKQDIISYYFKDINPLYFVCTDIEVEIGPSKDLIGINNIDDFYIFGTPFLIEITNREISNYYAGQAQILEFISI